MNLFATLDATWPAAATDRLGPWRLRRGEGGGNRVSAATLEGDLTDPGAAEQAMRHMGQAPLFMIRPGEDALDVALAARGYVACDATQLMVGPVARLADTTPDETAIACEAPLACMVEIWARGGIGPARLAVMARAEVPKIWMLGRLGDRPVAVAFVACAGEIAMLHAVHVEAAARRRGLGQRMARGAASWARAQGARTLALAVTEANVSARALYAGVGMTEVAGYHYRALIGSPGEPVA